MIDQAKLVAACRALIALVDAPQPGLASWNGACSDAARAIRESFSSTTAGGHHVEVAPGVVVAADGSARGPGLEQALATAADVATLDAYYDTRGVLWDVRQSGIAGRYTVNGFAHDAATAVEARRLAADAIRNGRVPR